MRTGGIHPGAAVGPAGDARAAAALPGGPACGQPCTHQRGAPLPAVQLHRPGRGVRQPLRHALPPRAPPHLRQAPWRHWPRPAGAALPASSPPQASAESGAHTASYITSSCAVAVSGAGELCVAAMASLPASTAGRQLRRCLPCYKCPACYPMPGSKAESLQEFDQEAPVPPGIAGQRWG